MRTDRKLEKNIYYDTLPRELTELLARSFSFNDIEALGKDLFYTYDTHLLENIIPEITISASMAAARLVQECRKAKKLTTLISYIVQLEGNYLNGKTVSLHGLEDLLYNIFENGYVFDYEVRKLMPAQKKKGLLRDWGVLREGKSYQIAVVSVDICSNSKFVKKYSAAPMQVIYNQLHEFVLQIASEYKGRVWSWAGDGGLLAFRGPERAEQAFRTALKLQLCMPLFNLRSKINLKENIEVRCGMDSGLVRFYKDIGRIVSETINHAAHVEKHISPPSGLGASDSIYRLLPVQLQGLFQGQKKFEGRTAYSLVFDPQLYLKMKGNINEYENGDEAIDQKVKTDADPKLEK